jgi:hypothetical protein
MGVGAGCIGYFICHWVRRDTAVRIWRSIQYIFGKFAYLGLYVFVQIRPVSIHDGEFISSSPVLNGAACYTMATSTSTTTTASTRRCETARAATTANPTTGCSGDGQRRSEGSEDAGVISGLIFETVQSQTSRSPSFRMHILTACQLFISYACYDQT